MVTLVVLIIVAVLLASSYYFLVPSDTSKNRPITVQAGDMLVDLTDLPKGWEVIGSSSTNYLNKTYPVASGLNSWAEGHFNSTDNGKNWEMSVLITSWNSTGIAQEGQGPAGNGKDTNYTSIDLGDEGIRFLPAFLSNDTLLMESRSAMYDFRVGNVFVSVFFDAHGSNIYYDTAWMKGMVDIQAAKVYQVGLPG
jgi:hypothetical protein